jgi:ubiquinone/menaquinone biosynthesis C-methylase UbiE
VSKGDAHRSIQEARRGFNAELLAPKYDPVHSDSEQLQQLIDYLAVEAEGVYLDLGTGNGYVAFQIAEHHRNCHVFGVDIADQAIGKNTEKARRAELSNLAFRTTDGIALAFPDGTFDGVISRYAFHHFPEPMVTLREIRRVMKASGRLVIADAVRNDDDHADFINHFQDLKKDGHVRMHKGNELVELISDCGFQSLGSHLTSLPFSRTLDAEHRALVERTPQKIQSLYDLQVKGDEVSLRFDILNVAFSRCPEPPVSPGS